MSDYKADVKLKPKSYAVKHGLGVVFFWIPLAEMRSPLPVLKSLELNNIGTQFDLTAWLQKLMEPGMGWLIIVYQMVETDQREPVEVIVSNDDAVLELARVPLNQTRVARLSFAHIQADLNPNVPHHVEIVLQLHS